MAARGARAAGGDAGDWVSQQLPSGHQSEIYARVQARVDRGRFFEGRTSPSSIAGTRRSIRSFTSDGSRSRSRGVAVLFASPIPAAVAAKVARATIPIVFAIGSDPVETGLVVSLNRPGGNITGATFLSIELGAKRVELLREFVPKVASIGLLVNPKIRIGAQTKICRAATTRTRSATHRPERKRSKRVR